jgi:hypothetical protein
MKANPPKERIVRELVANVNRAVRRVKNKKRGIKTTLTYEQLYSMMESINWKCAKTFIDFPLLDKGYKRWQLVDMNTNPLIMPSVDRIDSNAHYTIDNIQIVCQFYNLGKTDNEDRFADEIIKLIKRVDNEHSSKM